MCLKICLFENDVEVTGAEVIREATVQVNNVGGPAQCIIGSCGAGTNYCLKAKSAGGADFTINRLSFTMHRL